MTEPTSLLYTQPDCIEIAREGKKEVLYEAQGVIICRNPHNQFIVATVHHTADPLKRSEAWKRVASAGMSPAKSQREYDISYTAVQGSKVFPELSARKSEIVCPPLGELPGLKCWGGLDYGTQNPASFHIYTQIDGTIYSVWELYEPCKNIPEFVAKIKACPYWPQVRFVAADPSLWIPLQQQAYGPPVGIAELLRRAGLHNLVKGLATPGAEPAWIAMIRDHWAAETPTFRISSDCPAQIREFEFAIFTPQTDRQLENSVYHETIHDKNNHSLDDCKYFMLSQPKAGQLGNAGWEDPGQVYKLLGGSRPAGQAPMRSPRARQY